MSFGKLFILDPVKKSIFFKGLLKHLAELQSVITVVTSTGLCGFFKKIVEDLSFFLRSFFGSEEHSRVVGIGVSGDQSRYIDIIAEEHIVNKAKSAGLPAWVISEEKGRWTLSEKPELVLLVDPLDGSLNYSLGIPFASISLAVYHGIAKITEPVYGVVYNIFTGDSVELCNEKVFHNGIQVPKYLDRGFEVISVYTEDPKPLETILKEFKGKNVSVKTRTMGSASIEAVYAAIGLIGHFVHLTGRIRNTDLAVALAIADKLGAGVYTAPPLSEITVNDVQKIEKVVIASKKSPIWKLIDVL